jgi:hypothetical protein
MNDAVTVTYGGCCGRHAGGLQASLPMGMLLMLLLRSALLASTAGGSGHNGAPPSVPPGFDCALAHLQADFARQLQPWRRDEEHAALADALQLSSCPAAAAAAAPLAGGGAAGYRRYDSSRATRQPQHNLVVDCAAGDDSRGAGSSSAPLRTLMPAVQAARQLDGPVEIEVRGVCYLNETLHLNASDSHLTIRGAGADGATLVGGQLLEFSAAWRRSSIATKRCSIWERPLRSPAGSTTGRALRIAGRAATLARFPNAEPERDIYPTGWINDAANSHWLPPGALANPTLSAIESRPWLVRNDTLSIMDRWMVGVGGRCSDMSPAAGYWCIDDPTGWMGSGDVHRHPSGLTYWRSDSNSASESTYSLYPIRSSDDGSNDDDGEDGKENPSAPPPPPPPPASLLPNAPYANPSSVRLTAFGTGDHWFTWSFDEITYTEDGVRKTSPSVFAPFYTHTTHKRKPVYLPRHARDNTGKTQNKTTTRLYHCIAQGNHTFMFGRGGNQGAEGFDAAAEWYVEGPLEELVRKTASFFEFSPCLSRACLGKMIVLYI